MQVQSNSFSIYGYHFCFFCIFFLNFFSNINKCGIIKSKLPLTPEKNDVAQRCAHTSPPNSCKARSVLFSRTGKKVAEKGDPNPNPSWRIEEYMASSMAFADCSTSAPTRTFLFSRLRPRRGLPSIPPHLLRGLPVAGFRLPSLRITNSPSSFPKGTFLYSIYLFTP